jgi:hypothetical protein
VRKNLFKIEPAQKRLVETSFKNCTCGLVKIDDGFCAKANLFKTVLN